MADWKKLALAAILADGTIDENEVKIIRKELLADGKIDKQELDFLIELRNQAQKKGKGDLSPKFEKLFFDAVESRVLLNGAINKEGATLLRQVIFADKKVDDGEKKFLARLKKSATKAHADFDSLCNECLGASAAPKAKAAPAKTAAKAAPAPTPAAAPTPK